MKRLIALCLTAACLISLVGCAGDTNMDEKKPNNTASAYALALASYPEMAPYRSSWFLWLRFWPGSFGGSCPLVPSLSRAVMDGRTRSGLPGAGFSS